MASDSFVYRLGNGDEEGRRGGMEMKDEEAELSSGLMLGVVVEFAARSIPNTHFFWFVISIINSWYYLFDVDFSFHERQFHSIPLPILLNRTQSINQGTKAWYNAKNSHVIYTHANYLPVKHRSS
jgi:hypothetical protein